MKTLKSVLFILAIFGLFSTSMACKKHKKKNRKHKTEQVSKQTGDLKQELNKKWVLKTMQGAEGVVSGLNGDVWMQINTVENKINGKAPCNSYFGGLSSDYASTFKVENVGSTKMYCESVMKNEDAFFAHLNKVDAFKIEKGKLLLLTGDEVVLTFE